MIWTRQRLSAKTWCRCARRARPCAQGVGGFSSSGPASADPDLLRRPRASRGRVEAATFHAVVVPLLPLLEPTLELLSKCLIRVQGVPRVGREIEDVRCWNGFVDNEDASFVGGPSIEDLVVLLREDHAEDHGSLRESNLEMSREGRTLRESFLEVSDRCGSRIRTVEAQDCIEWSSREHVTPIRRRRSSCWPRAPDAPSPLPGAAIHLDPRSNSRRPIAA